MRVRFPLRRRKRDSAGPVGWVGLAPIPVTVRMRPPVITGTPDVVGARPILRRGAVLAAPMALAALRHRSSAGSRPVSVTHRHARSRAVPRVAGPEPVVTASWTDDDSISELRAILAAARKKALEPIAVEEPVAQSAPEQAPRAKRLSLAESRRNGLRVAAGFACGAGCRPDRTRCVGGARFGGQRAAAYCLAGCELLPVEVVRPAEHAHASAIGIFFTDPPPTTQSVHDPQPTSAAADLPPAPSTRSEAAHPEPVDGRPGRVVRGGVIRGQLPPGESTLRGDGDQANILGESTHGPSGRAAPFGESPVPGGDSACSRGRLGCSRG